VIDFHCHLDLYPDPHAVRDECVRRGLYVLSVTTTPSAWKGTSALTINSPRIRTALGLHPQLAHERRSELTLFDAFIHESMYAGEIGLDGTPDFRKHWDDQIAVFEHVLAKCRDVGGRIMSIHSRRASGAILDRLEKNHAAGSAIRIGFQEALAIWNGPSTLDAGSALVLRCSQAKREERWPPGCRGNAC
jgi:TatD DNase family protein